MILGQRWPTKSGFASVRADPGCESIGPTGGTVSRLYFAVVGDTRPANVDDTSGYPTTVITKIFQDMQGMSPPPTFGVSTGDIGRPLQDLEVSYKPVELRSCIERATAERQAVNVRDVEWAGEEESLAAVDILGLQAKSLIVVFDALGDRLQVEHLAELDEGVHER